jgi:hypothetical protein
MRVARVSHLLELQLGPQKNDSIIEELNHFRSIRGWHRSTDLELYDFRTLLISSSFILFTTSGGQSRSRNYSYLSQ